MEQKMNLQLTRYVVPFFFSSDHYQVMYQTLLESAVWERDTVKRDVEQDVYSYLLSVFDGAENHTDIGSVWAYTDGVGAGKKSDLLNMILLQDKKEDGSIDYMKVQMKAAGLFLYRTGVGFLWYELEIHVPDDFNVKQCAELQNKLKELNRRENVDTLLECLREGYLIERSDWKKHPEIQKKDCLLDRSYVAYKTAEKSTYLELSWLHEHSFTSPLPEGTEVILPSGSVAERKDDNTGDILRPAARKFTCCRSLTLGDWIARVLRTLDCPIQYCAPKRNCLYDHASYQSSDRSEPVVPDKALLFTYAVMPEGTDRAELIQTAFHIVNGYTINYCMPENMGENIFSPFSNLAWLVSREGCGCIAVENYSDGRNSNFFVSGLKNKMVSDYFLLYMLGLHRSYTLMRFSADISDRLSASVEDYEEDAAGFYENLERYEKEIDVFMIKSTNASVSHIQHQNGFYEYMQTRLHIREDIQNLTQGLSALTEILRIHHEEQEAIKREEERKKHAEMLQQEREAREKERLQEQIDREAQRLQEQIDRENRLKQEREDRENSRLQDQIDRENRQRAEEKTRREEQARQDARHKLEENKRNAALGILSILTAFGTFANVTALVRFLSSRYQNIGYYLTTPRYWPYYFGYLLVLVLISPAIFNLFRLVKQSKAEDDTQKELLIAELPKSDAEKEAAVTTAGENQPSVPETHTEEHMNESAK